MKIKQTIEKIPGGLMVVPLLLGALLNTIDQAHLPPVEAALEWLGAPAIQVEDAETGEVERHFEFLRIGGFATALFKTGALTLIGVFLVCVGAQMDFRVGVRSLKKGLVVAGTKLGVAVGVGYLVGVFTDPFNGFLGLSMMAVIAAMSNGNGGMYAALTGQYGNRSDVGALSVISLNDGPFFTLMALGLLGQSFPMIAFIAVLVPMAVGFILGQLDDDIRKFLKPGETLTIPFFAFALGTGMNFAVFLNPQVLAAGLFLGLATLFCTGLGGALILRLTGERSTLAAVAEASTAGNAVQTPLAVAAAAAGTQWAQGYADITGVAAAQISISTMTTAVLCPAAVIVWDRWQRRRGIDARADDEESRAERQTNAEVGIRNAE